MNREDLAPLSPALAVGKPGFAELQDIQHGPAQPSAKLLAARAIGFKVARPERLETLQCHATITNWFAAAAAAVIRGGLAVTDFLS